MDEAETPSAEGGRDKVGEKWKRERERKKSMDSKGGRKETEAWIGEGKKVKRKGSWIRKKEKRHRMEREKKEEN